MLDDMHQKNQIKGGIGLQVEEVLFGDSNTQSLSRIGLKTFVRLDARGKMAVLFKDLQGAADSRADFKHLGFGRQEGTELAVNALAVLPRPHDAAGAGGDFAVVFLAVVSGVKAGELRFGRNVAVGDEAAARASLRFEGLTLPVETADQLKLIVVTEVAAFAHEGASGERARKNPRPKWPGFGPGRVRERAGAIPPMVQRVWRRSRSACAGRYGQVK